MKIKALLLIFLALSLSGQAQVAINNDNSDPDPSAMLDVKSTDKGLLPPRMTLQERDAIQDPAEGLVVWNTTNKSLDVYNGSSWDPAAGSGDFVCGSSQIQDAEGNYYSTVQIGTQCWMAENINIGDQINGIDDQLDNGNIEKYCYDDIEANCDVYGGLYQWNEMMQYITTEGSQGICPLNWHIPTDSEWCTLENFVDQGTVSCTTIGWRGIDGGGHLKETGLTHWISPNVGATNSSQFTAIPSGYRGIDGVFHHIHEMNHFWSSNDSGSNAWYRYIGYQNSQIYRRQNSPKPTGFSVRCVRD